MDRINVFNLDGKSNWVESKNNNGHGKTGDIKRAGFFGKDIEVTIGKDKLLLNCGSVMDFIDAHHVPGTIPGRLKKGFWRWGWPEDKVISDTFQETINCLTKAKTGKEFDGTNWSAAQGKLDFYAKNYSRAAQHLETCTDLESIGMLGISYYKMGEEAGRFGFSNPSKEYLEKAQPLLEQAKETGEVLVHYGNLAFEKKDYKSASEYYAKAETKGAAYADLGLKNWQMLNKSYLDKGNNHPHPDLVTAAEGNDAAAKHVLGAYYYQKKNYRYAAQFLEAAFAMKPQTDIYAILKTIYEEIGDKNKANAIEKKAQQFHLFG